jgi:membrane fusion protein, multidrug efflux system
MPARSPVAALAAVMICSFLLSGCGEPQAQQAGPPKEPPPPEVTVVKLQTEKIAVFEEFVGQTDSADTVEVRARINGLLERQLAADGATVRRGQLLFTLDREPLVAAVNQVKAQLAQAEANAANSKQSLARIRPLAEEQAASQQDLDAAVARERSDAAAIDVVRAQLRTAELNLSYTEIRAPRDGVLSRALVRPGGVVTQGTSLLATLYAMDPMYVNFTVPEARVFDFQKRLGALQTGVEKTLPFTIALPDGTQYKYPPRLSMVDPAVDPKNGTLQVRLAVSNTERALKPGLIVKVRAPSYENPNGIRIPGRAVTEILGRRSVYIVAADGKFETRDLIGAQRVGQDWVVEKGFQPGEQVIIEGIGKIRPGLSMVKPMPPKPPAGSPGKAPAGGKSA